MWAVLRLEKTIETTTNIPVTFEAEGQIGYLPVFALLSDAKRAYPGADYVEIKEKEPRP